MTIEQVLSVLLGEDVNTEEIISFISETFNVERGKVERSLSMFIQDNKNKGLSYKYFEKLLEKEREYFLKNYYKNGVETAAEIFAEMATLLERQMILKDYYMWKLKMVEAEGRISRIKDKSGVKDGSH
ncbi:hypothetical protein [Desulfurobacterium sp.]